MKVLEYINKQLKSIGINYAFMRWKGEISYPYFVGEYNEPEPTEEDQYVETTFILTGFTRGTWKELLQEKTRIENLFSSHTTTLDDGSGVVISYAGSFPIPIEEEELKKIQINIKIQEWRVK